MLGFLLVFLFLFIFDSKDEETIDFSDLVSKGKSLCLLKDLWCKTTSGKFA